MTIKALNIRNVRPEELPFLLALNQANLPQVGSISLREMHHLHNQASGFLIAFEPRADYGSLNFLWFKKRYPNFVYIDRIVIAAEARRNGIALALYRNLEDFAAQRHIPQMTCEYNLRPPNEISRQFHQKYGFKEVGTQETEKGKKTVSLQIKEVSRQ